MLPSGLEWLYTLGAVCGCITAIGGLFWGLWSFVRKIVRIMDMLEKMRTPVDQLRSNGGSSVKDKVDESHQLLHTLVERIERLEKHNEGH